MIIRANAQKTQPVLIPALAAVLRVSDGDDGDVGGVAALVVVVAGETVGDAFVDDEEEAEAEAEEEDGDRKDEDKRAVVV